MYGYTWGRCTPGRTGKLKHNIGKLELFYQTGWAANRLQKQERAYRRSALHARS
jgi:hypothetical protein